MQLAGFWRCSRAWNLAAALLYCLVPSPWAAGCIFQSGTCTTARSTGGSPMPSGAFRVSVGWVVVVKGSDVSLQRPLSCTVRLSLLHCQAHPIYPALFSLWPFPCLEQAGALPGC